MSEGASVNTGAVEWPGPDQAHFAVRRMQIKLHRWAGEDSSRRFGDLFNLVYDPAFLRDAWERVAANVGARTPGIDRATVARIETRIGVEAFLEHLRDLLRSGEFRPVEVRQVMIPKASGKLRKLGIPTVADRVVQASLKAVFEPIFEADFVPLMPLTEIPQSCSAEFPTPGAATVADQSGFMGDLRSSRACRQAACVRWSAAASLASRILSRVALRKASVSSASCRRRQSSIRQAALQ